MQYVLRLIKHFTKLAEDLDEILVSICKDNMCEYKVVYEEFTYFEDDTLRDLIHKGYIVVYKIDFDNNNIVILGINKYKKMVKI